MMPGERAARTVPYLSHSTGESSLSLMTGLGVRINRIKRR